MNIYSFNSQIYHWIGWTKKNQKVALLQVLFCFKTWLPKKMIAVLKWKGEREEGIENQIQGPVDCFVNTEF